MHISNLNWEINNVVKAKQRVLPKGFRRWHVVNKENGYTHGGFANRAYAIRIARELSCSLRVQVIDKLGNAIVWGY